MEEVYETGDFGIDNDYVFNEEEEIEDVPEMEDEDASFDFFDMLLQFELSEPAYNELRDNYGAVGVEEVGKRMYSNVHSEIAQKESGGNYKAYNPAGGGSGAVGKYQFRWDIWKDEIAEKTGITTKEEFLNNPQAQEYFYNDYYIPNKALPWVAQAKRHLKVNIPDNELIKLYHFRGPKGAIDFLRGQVSDKPEVYNSSISGYTGIKPGNYLKDGGWVRMQVAGVANFIPTNLAAQQDYLKGSQKQETTPPKHETTPPNDFSNIGSKISSGADAISGLVNGIRNFKQDVNNLKGKGLDVALSSAASAASSRRQREAEQEYLKMLYESEQNAFNDTVDETLGKQKNIWE